MNDIPIIQNKRYIEDGGEWEVTDSDGVHYYGDTLGDAIKQYAEAAANYAAFCRHDPVSAGLLQEGRNGNNGR